MSLKNLFSKDEMVKAFFPFVKFAKDGEFVIGVFQKRVKDEERGSEVLDNVYLDVTDSNITSINVTKEKPKGETVKSLKGKIVSIALTTDLFNKFNSIAKELIPEKTIVAIERIGLSDEFGVGENMMILFDVFIRNTG